jgi:hypothetical protein
MVVIARDQTRGELRRAESAAVLAALKDWTWGQASLKTLSIGNAAAYVVANWDRLTRFVQDARIPLDNNATERGIRGPVVGRKNHYGTRGDVLLASGVCPAPFRSGL